MYADAINGAFKNNTAYMITSIVLSKDEPFTIEQISSGLKEHGIIKSEHVIRRRLNSLRDTGILFEQGSYYSVNNACRRKLK